MSAPEILLLAAGASRRMRGEDKLLRPVEGLPLVARMARMALAACPDVRVVLPAEDRARAACLADLDVTCLRVQSREMSASIRAGVAARGGPVLILLADMPALEAEDLRALFAAARTAPERIIRGAQGGKPGQPVLFPARFRAALRGLSGDQGARELVARNNALLVPLPGNRALLDLDTPEDWEAWPARQR